MSARLPHRLRAARLAAAIALVAASGCGGPLISYFNNSFDGEKGDSYHAAEGFEPTALGEVVVISPFETGPRGPIICCGKDASTFATKFNDVTTAPVKLVTIPNGAHPADYRRVLEEQGAEELARMLGIAPTFDTVIFGAVEEHEGFLRAVHGYSADITMRVEALGADGRPRFEGTSRVQYPADTIARESAKVISEHVAGRR